MRNRLYGLTLIELLVTMAIIGGLAAIAYPAYTQYTVRAARSEAVVNLQRIADLQERDLLNNGAYFAGNTDVDPGLGGRFVMYMPPGESARYSYQAVLVGDGYRLTATAIGNQASDDAECATLSLDSTGSRSASDGNSDTTNNCW